MSGNQNFTGISNPNNLVTNRVVTHTLNTVNLNAINKPKIGTTIIGQLPNSFYSNPFNAGLSTNPNIMVDAFQNPIQIPINSGYYLQGMTIAFNGFGQATGGSFANPTNLYLGTTNLAKTNVAFVAFNNNQVPLTNGSIQILNASQATITVQATTDTTAGNSVIQAGSATGIITPSSPGWSVLNPLLVNTITYPNNYLCCYFTALATQLTSNAIGSFYVYITYVGTPPFDI